MLLTITTTARPATDLGYLLHKHPDRHQSFDLSFGRAHVFYPEARPERCTAALLLDVDPIGLVRRRGAHDAALIDHYVNDRPYVASSFLSVAIARVYGTALAGRSGARPELAAATLPLEARVVVLPCRDGEAFLRRLFEPLGYAVEAERRPLDPRAPERGESHYYTVTLRGDLRLRDLLTHLYVLVPVLDDAKHYWVGEDEIEKLLRHGETWLAGHPERETIARRYLAHQAHLTRSALARLTADESLDPDAVASERAAEEASVEERLSLAEQRLGAVVAALKARQARRVLDLGCGEGRLLTLLARDPAFEEIVGLDVSVRVLEVARERIERLPERARSKVRLLHGALTYRDRRLVGFDAATIIEVIEHLDPARLAAFERVVFDRARPGAVVLTTPNVEYNVRFETLPAGTLRHRDHRFEWTRAEFREWAGGVGRRFGYTVDLLPVGPEDPVVGPPTQMAVFARAGEPVDDTIPARAVEQR